MVGPFADELMTAHLTEDSWRHRHDNFKVTLVNMCNEARVPIDCEVFGIFRDLIPAALTAEGGELQFGRKRAGLCPDFRLRLPGRPSPQRPVRLTHWANSNSFLPESRATPSPGPRSRWTGGQESSQALTGGHWRGWTGCTMPLQKMRWAH